MCTQRMRGVMSQDLLRDFRRVCHLPAALRRVRRRQRQRVCHLPELRGRQIPGYHWQRDVMHRTLSRRALCRYIDDIAHLSGSTDPRHIVCFYWHCPEQDLCNGTVSVRLSVPAWAKQQLWHSPTCGSTGSQHGAQHPLQAVPLTRLGGMYVCMYVIFVRCDRHTSNNEHKKQSQNDIEYKTAKPKPCAGAMRPFVEILWPLVVGVHRRRGGSMSVVCGRMSSLYWSAVRLYAVRRWTGTVLTPLYRAMRRRTVPSRRRQVCFYLFI